MQTYEKRSYVMRIKRNSPDYIQCGTHCVRVICIQIGIFFFFF